MVADVATVAGVLVLVTAPDPGPDTLLGWFPLVLGLLLALGTGALRLAS